MGLTVVQFLPPITRVADDAGVQPALVQGVPHLVGLEAHRSVELPTRHIGRAVERRWWLV